MIAKREIWNYSDKSHVWAGKYRNSHNIPHWHTDCELLYLCNGKIDIYCNNTCYSLKPKEAFFVDTEQIHYMHAQTDDTVLAVIIFDYGIIEKIMSGKTFENPHFTADYNIEKLYETIKKEQKKKLAFYEQVVVGKVCELFINLVRNEQPIERKKENSTSQNLRKLLDEISVDYDTITFESACKTMALEQAYFSRYFRKNAGMSFSDYLNYVKIDNAVKMLKNGLTASQTSIKCGFDSVRTFNRNFKKLTGYTPKELPKDFVFSEFFVHSDSSINPTGKETSLLE